ncbi:hypothetical protein [Microbacterium sp. SS28]|uniref:hypothetical protein n=1 Tax=Microbacterium sp. SS28 TaxID=2919948 RepID=UPI001FAB2728|nr:hypothetical protein [Microbacterium sp. SS28]
MRNTVEARFMTRTLVLVAIAGAALGLAACQTAAESVAPVPVVAPQSGPVDQRMIDEYAGRPADRVAEDLERRVRNGELPSSSCRRHTVVEHPDGGYHLVCTERVGE